jgi:hypothetical protein
MSDGQLGALHGDFIHCKIGNAYFVRWFHLSPSRMLNSVDTVSPFGPMGWIDSPIRLLDWYTWGLV